MDDTRGMKYFEGQNVPTYQGNSKLQVDGREKPTCTLSVTIIQP